MTHGWPRVGYDAAGEAVDVTKPISLQPSANLLHCLPPTALSSHFSSLSRGSVMACSPSMNATQNWWQCLVQQPKNRSASAEQPSLVSKLVRRLHNAQNLRPFRC